MSNSIRLVLPDHFYCWKSGGAAISVQPLARLTPSLWGFLLLAEALQHI